MNQKTSLLHRLSLYNVVFFESQHAHGYANPKNNAPIANNTSIFLLASSV